MPTLSSSPLAAIAHHHHKLPQICQPPAYATLLSQGQHPTALLNSIRVPQQQAALVQFREAIKKRDFSHDALHFTKQLLDPKLGFMEYAGDALSCDASDIDYSYPQVIDGKLYIDFRFMLRDAHNPKENLLEIGGVLNTRPMPAKGVRLSLVSSPSMEPVIIKALLSTMTILQHMYLVNIKP